MDRVGLTLLPLIAGIGFLFFDGKSVAGWVLTLARAVILLVDIPMNLAIYFRPTSLFNTLVMHSRGPRISPTAPGSPSLVRRAAASFPYPQCKNSPRR